MNAVHNLGRHSSNRMPHDVVADCDLSPLRPAHSLTIILLLLSEPKEQEVSREDSAAHAQHSEFWPFCRTRQPSERNLRKEQTYGITEPLNQLE